MLDAAVADSLAHAAVIPFPQRCRRRTRHFLRPCYRYGFLDRRPEIPLVRLEHREGYVGAAAHDDDDFALLGQVREMGFQERWGVSESDTGPARELHEHALVVCHAVARPCCFGITEDDVLHLCALRELKSSGRNALGGEGGRKAGDFVQRGEIASTERGREGGGALGLDGEDGCDGPGVAVQAEHDAVEETAAADAADDCVRGFATGELAREFGDEGAVAFPDVGVVEGRDVDPVLIAHQDLRAEVLVCFAPCCAVLDYVFCAGGAELGDHEGFCTLGHDDGGGAGEGGGGGNARETGVAA